MVTAVAGAVGEAKEVPIPLTVSLARMGLLSSKVRIRTGALNIKTIRQTTHAEPTGNGATVRIFAAIGPIALGKTG